MTPEEFQNRLDAISKYEDIPYGRAHKIFEKEAEHGQSVLQFKGYLALSDAFKCLFLETVELINIECRPKVAVPLSEFYAIFLPKVVHGFQSLCGAERVAINGYPYHAYSLLRNIFDNLVLTSAAVQRVTDFYSIEGVVPGTNLDMASVKKLRKDTEFVVRRKMTGKDSGLTLETIAELAQWDELFDFEVHGARLSLAGTQEWMKGKASLPVLPEFNERQFAMFMNRFCEVGWMLHRLMPLVQPSTAPLPNAWQEKWRVLDESFEIMVFSLTKQFGKKIGAAMVELVKNKFPFHEKSVFPL